MLVLTFLRLNFIKIIIKKIGLKENNNHGKGAHKTMLQKMLFV